MEEEQRLVADLQVADPVCVVALQGEIDLSTAPLLQEALRDATARAPHVILDMGRVSYMDSSGFGTLLGATKRLRPQGGSLHLVGCNPTIERMLQITRLDTLFDTHRSEEDARRAITARVAAPPAAA